MEAALARRQLIVHRRFFPAVVNHELDEDVAADAPAVGAPADGPTPPCRLLMEPTAASSSTDHHIAADGYENVEDANFQDLLLATVPSEVPPVPLIEMTPEIKGFLERADQVWSQGPEGPGSRPRPSSACTEQARQTIDAGQTAVDPPQMVIPMPGLVPKKMPRPPPPWRRGEPPIIYTNLAQPSQVNCQGPSFVSTFRITSTRKRALARSNSEKPSSCHVESVGKYVLECITSSLTHKHVSHKS